MFIINNENNIILGEKNFYDIYGFSPSELLCYLQLININKFNTTIYHKNISYNIICEPFYDNERLFWLINVTKNNDKILEFNFTVSTDYIITNWYSKNNNLNINYFDAKNYENQKVEILNDELYEEIKNIYENDILLKKNNKAFLIKEKIVDINQFEILCIIIYNFTENNFKIFCKNINSIIKDKIHTIYEKSSLSKKNFISHIFHEIRNYLNVISLACDNLFQETNDLSTTMINNRHLTNSLKYISDIHDASFTITDILSDVLTIEKFKNSNININLRQFMFNDLFNKCVHTMESHLNTKNIVFNYHNLITGNISIIADYIKIKQVIINLLSNAVKFTNERGHITFIVKEELIIDNDQKYKYLLFEIIDDGIGIQDKYKDKIFKAYEQIDAEYLQQGGGIGLGLSISKYIIEKHKGVIGFNSIYKKGTTFFFKIPLILSENEFQSGSGSGSGSNSIGSGSINSDNNDNNGFIILEKKEPIDITKHNILVVDDNIIIVKMLKNMLKKLGVNFIATASDGNEAIIEYEKAYTNNNPFSLVFMDQEMPNVNGNVATKKILEMDSNAIIIGITGNAFSEQIEEFISYGAKKVFPKPINFEIVNEIINNFFRNVIKN
jgi:signal transduction histidine kinase/ActR/RegA family two-component response regulator